MSVKNYYPGKPIIPFFVKKLDMGAVVAALKNLPYNKEVKRSAYAIMRTETANLNSVINGTNFCGAQSDSGKWPDKWDNHIVATCNKNENMTGRERGFVVFDTIESGLSFLCERVQAKGIFIGENVDGKYYKGDVKTPDQNATAYVDEWVMGETIPATTSQIKDWESIYKQASTIFT